MKKIHTQKKSANRSFDKRHTGFRNSLEHRQYNQLRNSPDKTDKRFTKPKPVRQKRIRQTTQNK